MKYWKGKWIITVSVLHILFAVFSFQAQYTQMLVDGFINSASTPLTGLATWFLLFGVLMFVSGLLLLSLEKTEVKTPKSVIYGFLFLTVLGVAIMPASGFWLIFPPVLALLSKKTPALTTYKIE